MFKKTLKNQKRNLTGAIGSTSIPTSKPLLYIGLSLFILISLIFVFSFIDFGSENNLGSLFFEEKEEIIETGNLSYSSGKNHQEEEFFDNSEDILNSNRNLEESKSFNHGQGEKFFSDGLGFQDTNNAPNSILDNDDEILKKLKKDFEQSKKVAVNTNRFIENEQLVSFDDVRDYESGANEKKINEKANEIFNNSQANEKLIKEDKATVKKDAYGCIVNEEIYIKYLGCQANNGNTQKGEIVLAKAHKKKNISKGKNKDITNSYIEKGYKIPVILTSDITSQFTGIINAISAQDIYDSSKEKIIIPKGSIFYGKNDEIKAGYDKNRMQLHWTEVKIGENLLSLKNLGTVDKTGQTGIKVDNNVNYGKLFVTSMLVALVGAGIDSSSDDPFTKSLNKQLTNTSNKILDSHLNARPKFQIKKGTKLNIVLSQRLYF